MRKSQKPSHTERRDVVEKVMCVDRKIGLSRSKLVCPICQNVLFSLVYRHKIQIYIQAKKMNYCQNCGQHLSWDKYYEENQMSFSGKETEPS